MDTIKNHIDKLMETALAINAERYQLQVEQIQLRTVLQEARRVIISAVTANCDIPDFDASEHFMVKRIDAALGGGK